MGKRLPGGSVLTWLTPEMISADITTKEIAVSGGTYQRRTGYSSDSVDNQAGRP